MLVKIETHSGKPIFRQIYDQIKLQILTGQIAEGEQIMSVRDLSLALKVNPMTVSKSYSMLESAHFLERRRGIGLFAVLKKNAFEKEEVFLNAVKDAAIMGVQLGIDEGRAAAIFCDTYKKYVREKQ